MKDYFLGALIVYLQPFWRLRHQWRGMVYQDYSHSINWQPRFMKETLAIFTNRFFKKDIEKRFALYFRLYLIGYFTLLSLALG